MAILNKDLKVHNWLYILLLFAVIVIYVTNLVLGSQNSNKSVYPNSIGNLSRKYKNDITPANWVFFIIWPIIYAWQIAWLVYAVVCLFRRVKSDEDQESDGALLYRRVDFIHYGGLLAFGVNFILVICWTFAWTYECLFISFILLAAPTLALYVCLFIFLHRFNLNYHEFLEFDLKADIWLARILLHNGLALYGTWLSLATNLNLTTVLIYTFGVDTSCAGTTALSIISVLILVYFILENFIWQRYLLYVFTPWAVLIFALTGSLIKNWKSESEPSTNNIITVVMLCVVGLLALGKLVMFILFKTKFKNRVDHIIFRRYAPAASEDDDNNKE